MRIYVSSETSQGFINFFLFTRLFDSFDCEFFCSFGPLSLKVELGDLFSFFEERFFGEFGTRIVVDAAVTLGFADNLLVNERGGFGPD